MRLFVWCLFFLASSALGLDINGELKKAELENLTSDPTCNAGSEARVYWDTDDNLFRLCDGSSWMSVTTFATPISIANGGTNKALTLAAGGLIYADADSFEQGSAGTAQNWALSGGTGAPTFSNTTTTAKVIDMAADGVGLTIQGNTSYTGNTLLIENGAGTDLFAVNGNGTWSAPVGRGTLERLTVYDIDVSTNDASTIFLGAPTISTNGRVALFMGTAGSGVACAAATGCLDEEAAHGLGTGSGGCLMAFVKSNSNVLTCAATDAVDKLCLCVGAVQN